MMPDAVRAGAEYAPQRGAFPMRAAITPLTQQRDACVEDAAPPARYATRLRERRAMASGALRARRRGAFAELPYAAARLRHARAKDEESCNMTPRVPPPHFDFQRRQPAPRHAFANASRGPASLTSYDYEPQPASAARWHESAPTPPRLFTGICPAHCLSLSGRAGWAVSDGAQRAAACRCVAGMMRRRAVCKERRREVRG